MDQNIDPAREAMRLRYRMTPHRLDSGLPVKT